MDKITSLNDLNKKITDFFISNHQEYNNPEKKFNLNNVDFLKIINSYEGQDWKEHENVNEEKYNRKTVYTDPENRFDIHIITWNCNQKSSIHGHAPNGCVMKILSGKLKEVRYGKLGERNISIRSYIHKEKDISYIDDKIGYHFIKNNTDSVSVSLHIYSPAKFKFNFEDFDNL